MLSKRKEKNILRITQKDQYNTFMHYFFSVITLFGCLSRELNSASVADTILRIIYGKSEACVKSHQSCKDKSCDLASLSRDEMQVFTEGNLLLIL